MARPSLLLWVFFVFIVVEAEPVAKELAHLVHLHDNGDLNDHQFVLLAKELMVGHHGDQLLGEAGVPRLLQQVPDGVSGSQLWLKSESAKIVLGPEADTSIARAAPNTLATGALQLTADIGTQPVEIPRNPTYFKDRWHTATAPDSRMPILA